MGFLECCGSHLRQYVESLPIGTERHRALPVCRWCQLDSEIRGA